MGKNSCTSCKDGVFERESWEVVKEFGSRFLCENYKCNKCGAESKRKRSK
ncbi:hypothetical protein LCGC14_2699330 [marine sediment metagenome]|uniref:Uncharacterized protein n=1 Tax=marine sediment metagenome TaxID=412755 RepID=A0A0F9BQI8_9ZZZZ